MYNLNILHIVASAYLFEYNIIILKHSPRKRCITSNFINSYLIRCYTMH